MVLYIYILVTETSSIERIANLGGGHRGYGKVDLPKVNTTWYNGTRWELNPDRRICIPNRVPLYHGPTQLNTTFIVCYLVEQLINWLHQQST